ncbi:MAG TPA: HEAT repeat domain-containing protein [Candidatus Omnitrophota bacterium]|nr:HEAT repeat domain-containing protein [Candidatus Omnitrophota bacterium]HRZ14079.1 HEAT repeat domain-containing protein [Candidatus Omnitrophota bacterium]
MFKLVKRIVAFAVVFCLVLEQSGFAQVAPQFNIPTYINGYVAPDKFRPVQLRSISFDQKSQDFNLLLDKGDARKIKPQQVQLTTKELVSYFNIGIALPNSTFWVNLRPDAKDQVIDPWLERTEVGRILLAADLQLKKDMAAFTSPKTKEGKNYWNKLYSKAEEIFGRQDITIPTITRPWIVPGEILVRETPASAYIFKATLKVMLEQDWLPNNALFQSNDPKIKQLNEYSSAIIRKEILPKLTREVNSSKKYAALRQVYYSLVLAQWFKEKYRGQEGSAASKIDQRDLTGLTSAKAWSRDTYFNDYKRSFEKGEYNISETVSTPTGMIIRQYFSGGIRFADIDPSAFTLKAGGAQNYEAISRPTVEIPAGTRFEEGLIKVKPDGRIIDDGLEAELALAVSKMPLKAGGAALPRDRVAEEFKAPPQDEKGPDGGKADAENQQIFEKFNEIKPEAQSYSANQVYKTVFELQERGLNSARSLTALKTLFDEARKQSALGMGQATMILGVGAFLSISGTLIAGVPMFLIGGFLLFLSAKRYLVLNTFVREIGTQLTIDPILAKNSRPFGEVIKELRSIPGKELNRGTVREVLSRNKMLNRTDIDLLMYIMGTRTSPITSIFGFSFVAFPALMTMGLLGVSAAVMVGVSVGIAAVFLAARYVHHKINQKLPDIMSMLKEEYYFAPNQAAEEEEKEARLTVVSAQRAKFVSDYLASVSHLDVHRDSLSSYGKQIEKQIQAIVKVLTEHELNEDEFNSAAQIVSTCAHRVRDSSNKVASAEKMLREEGLFETQASAKKAKAILAGMEIMASLANDRNIYTLVGRYLGFIAYADPKYFKLDPLDLEGSAQLTLQETSAILNRESFTLPKQFMSPLLESNKVNVIDELERVLTAKGIKNPVISVKRAQEYAGQDQTIDWSKLKKNDNIYINVYTDEDVNADTRQEIRFELLKALKNLGVLTMSGYRWMQAELNGGEVYDTAVIVDRDKNDIGLWLIIVGKDGLDPNGQHKGNERVIPAADDVFLVGSPDGGNRKSKEVYRSLFDFLTVTHSGRFLVGSTLMSLSMITDPTNTLAHYAMGSIVGGLAYDALIWMATKIVSKEIVRQITDYLVLTFPGRMILGSFLAGNMMIANPNISLAQYAMGIVLGGVVFTGLLGVTDKIIDNYAPETSLRNDGMETGDGGNLKDKLSDSQLADLKDKAIKYSAAVSTATIIVLGAALMPFGFALAFAAAMGAGVIAIVLSNKMYRFFLDRLVKKAGLPSVQELQSGLRTGLSMENFGLAVQAKLVEPFKGQKITVVFKDGVEWDCKFEYLNNDYFPFWLYVKDLDSDEFAPIYKDTIQSIRLMGDTIEDAWTSIPQLTLDAAKSTEPVEFKVFGKPDMVSEDDISKPLSWAKEDSAVEFAKFGKGRENASKPANLKGKTFTVKETNYFHEVAQDVQITIQGTFEEVFGMGVKDALFSSSVNQEASMLAAIYMDRANQLGLPKNNLEGQVYYGSVGNTGEVVHVSELNDGGKHDWESPYYFRELPDLLTGKYAWELSLWEGRAVKPNLQTIRVKDKDADIEQHIRYLAWTNGLNVYFPSDKEEIIKSIAVKHGDLALQDLTLDILKAAEFGLIFDAKSEVQKFAGRIEEAVEFTADQRAELKGIKNQKALINFVDELIQTLQDELDLTIQHKQQLLLSAQENKRIADSIEAAWRGERPSDKQVKEWAPYIHQRNDQLEQVRTFEPRIATLNENIKNLNRFARDLETVRLPVQPEAVADGGSAKVVRELIPQMERGLRIIQFIAQGDGQASSHYAGITRMFRDDIKLIENNYDAFVGDIADDRVLDLAIRRLSDNADYALRTTNKTIIENLKKQNSKTYFRYLSIDDIRAADEGTIGDVQKEAREFAVFLRDVASGKSKVEVTPELKMGLSEFADLYTRMGPVEPEFAFMGIGLIAWSHWRTDYTWGAFSLVTRACEKTAVDSNLDEAMSMVRIIGSNNENEAAKEAAVAALFTILASAIEQDADVFDGGTKVQDVEIRFYNQELNQRNATLGEFHDKLNIVNILKDYSGDIEIVMYAMLDVLQNKSTGLRRAAIQKLTEVGNVDVLRAVIAAMQVRQGETYRADPRAERTRITAIRAVADLFRFEPVAAVQSLAAILSKGAIASLEVKREAIWALKRINTQYARDVLHDVLNNNYNENDQESMAVRKQAELALAELDEINGEVSDGGLTKERRVQMARFQELTKQFNAYGKMDFEEKIEIIQQLGKLGYLPAADFIIANFDRSSQGETAIAAEALTMIAVANNDYSILEKAVVYEGLMNNIAFLTGLRETLKAVNPAVIDSLALNSSIALTRFASKNSTISDLTETVNDMVTLVKANDQRKAEMITALLLGSKSAAHVSLRETIVRALGTIFRSEKSINGPALSTFYQLINDPDEARDAQRIREAVAEELVRLINAGIVEDDAFFAESNNPLETNAALKAFADALAHDLKIDRFKAEIVEEMKEGSNGTVDLREVRQFVESRDSAGLKIFFTQMIKNIDGALDDANKKTEKLRANYRSLRNMPMYGSMSLANRTAGQMRNIREEIDVIENSSSNYEAVQAVYRNAIARLDLDDLDGGKDPLVNENISIKLRTLVGEPLIAEIEDMNYMLENKQYAQYLANLMEGIENKDPFAREYVKNKIIFTIGMLRLFIDIEADGALKQRIDAVTGLDEFASSEPARVTLGLINSRIIRTDSQDVSRKIVQEKLGLTLYVPMLLTRFSREQDYIPESGEVKRVSEAITALGKIAPFSIKAQVALLLVMDQAGIKTKNNVQEIAELLWDYNDNGKDILKARALWRILEDGRYDLDETAEALVHIAKAEEKIIAERGLEAAGDQPFVYALIEENIDKLNEPAKKVLFNELGENDGGRFTAIIEKLKSLLKSGPAQAVADAAAAKKTPDNTGGVDFRALPIQSQAVIGAVNPAQILQSMPQAMKMPLAELDAKWLNIQEKVKSGSMPYRELKEFVAVCNARADATQQMHTAVLFIKQILEMEEERALPTAGEMKEIIQLAIS